MRFTERDDASRDRVHASRNASGETREVAYDTRSPAIIALAADGRVARLDLAVGGGVLEGELRQDDAGAAIRATLTGVDLRTISPDLLGRVTADVEAENGVARYLYGTKIDVTDEIIAMSRAYA